jgi:hypothetical protein
MSDRSKLYVGPRANDLKKNIWRKIHKDKLCSSYCVPNSIKVIESRKVKWIVLVVIVEEMRNIDYPRRMSREERNYLRGLEASMRKMLKSFILN